MDAACRQFLGATDVIYIVRVAAVDDRITFGEQRQQVGDGPVHDRRRHHQPDGARLLELFHELRQRSSASNTFLRQLLHRFR